MSVQSEINRISANVTDTHKAIREAGISVSGTAKSDDMAAAVRKVITDVNALLDEINGEVI